MKRQYCASSFCIDFENETVLLMYNRKLKKWLQPGGHIQDDELELPWKAAIREVYEETGIRIKIIGPSYDGEHIEPISVSHYTNKVGDMIDIQYLSTPLTKELANLENNEVVWFPLQDLESSKQVDTEIKIKAKHLYNEYKMKKS